MADAKIPTHVQVGPWKITVVCDAAELAKEQAKARDGRVGSYDSNGQRVIIDPDLGPDQTAGTLLHEVLHACFSTAGLDGEDLKNSEDVEEAVVRSLEPILLDTLRRNPSLIAYLTA